MSKRATQTGSVSRRVISAMGIFSGVQMVSIICSIIRTKCVALWIGTVSVGLFGIYNSALDLIATLSQMSVRTSAVRDIASASTPSSRWRWTCIVRRWTLWLALAGALLTMALSPLLSFISFGDTSHTWAFILLALAVFAIGATSGEQALLQGTSRLGRLAKASMIGVVGGMAVSIPMFRWLGIDSILPSILAYSIITAVAFVALGARVDKVADSTPRNKAVFHEGLPMVRLGFYLTISAVIMLLANYLLNSWLNRRAGTEIVGYYQAGYTVVGRYVGLVFMAIAMEYYPRLSRVTQSLKRTSVYVSHEMYLALLVIVPAVIWVMSLDDVILHILYDSDFEIAAPYITFAAAGTAFRAIGWCLSFVILARGNGRVYFACEAISSLAFLACSILGYEAWGLEGMGVGYAVWLMVYAATVSVVCIRGYGLRINKGVIAVGLISIVTIATAAICRMYDLRAATIALAVATSIYAIKKVWQLLR